MPRKTHKKGQRSARQATGSNFGPERISALLRTSRADADSEQDASDGQEPLSRLASTRSGQ
jgi:hypothetical protein